PRHRLAPDAGSRGDKMSGISSASAGGTLTQRVVWALTGTVALAKGGWPGSSVRACRGVRRP
ncbi:hypothetical protein DAI43_28745, partial [Achromobacter xylosoxidans]